MRNAGTGSLREVELQREAGQRDGPVECLRRRRRSLPVVRAEDLGQIAASHDRVVLDRVVRVLDVAEAQRGQMGEQAEGDHRDQCRGRHPATGQCEARRPLSDAPSDNSFTSLAAAPALSLSGNSLTTLSR